MASKKDKLGPLRKRLKEMQDNELATRLYLLTQRIAMDNREIEIINKELKGRAE